MMLQQEIQEQLKARNREILEFVLNVPFSSLTYPPQRGEPGFKEFCMGLDVWQSWKKERDVEASCISWENDGGNSN